MYGDSPQEAVTTFLEPFEAALCVLDGRGYISIARHGLWAKYRTYSWVLNPQKGMKLGDAGTLYASMQFQVIDTDPASNQWGKRLEVTTVGYNYSLKPASGSDRWRMHLHLDGVSPVREPHLHIPPDLKVHRPCHPMNFELAIRWCITDGAPLACTPQEAELVLREIELRWAGWRDLPDQRS